MPNLVITRSHPILKWLTSKSGSRIMPKQTMAELSKITDFGQAQEFLQKAGLTVLSHVRRLSPSVISISIAPPEGSIEYYAPQIIISTVDTVEVPRGSVLMNCLIPETETEAEGQKIFAHFQSTLLALSKRLAALPFACITGHKTETPKHIFYHRGFRFLFGPAHAPFYQRVKDSLEANKELMDLVDSPYFAGDPKKAEEALDLAKKTQQLKFAKIKPGKGKIGHSILEDMKLMETQTILVDLR